MLHIVLAIHDAVTSGGDGLYDEAAMLTAFGAFITGMVMLWRQRQHRHATDRIEDTLNHTKMEPPDNDEDMTLGQRLVKIQRDVEDGFTENTRVHDLLRDAVHQQGQRLDAVRSDLNDTRAHIRRLHPEDPS